MKLYKACMFSRFAIFKNPCKSWYLHMPKLMSFVSSSAGRSESTDSLEMRLFREASVCGLTPYSTSRMLSIANILVGMVAVARRTYGVNWPEHCAILRSTDSLSSYNMLGFRPQLAFEVLSSNSHWALMRFSCADTPCEFYILDGKKLICLRDNGVGESSSPRQ